MSQKITPCLWFDDRIAEAADYYARVFKGKVTSKSHYPDGRMLTANVDILGTNFTLLNGGPDFTFSEAISFYIDCKDQPEIDYYWTTLTADGGAQSMCGWVKATAMPASRKCRTTCSPRSTRWKTPGKRCAPASTRCSRVKSPISAR